MSFTQLIRIGLRLRQLVDDDSYFFDIEVLYPSVDPEQNISQFHRIELSNAFPSNSIEYSMPLNQYVIRIGFSSRLGVLFHQGILSVFDLEVYAESVNGLFDRMVLDSFILNEGKTKIGGVATYPEAPYIALTSRFDGVLPPPYDGGVIPTDGIIPIEPTQIIPTGNEDASWWNSIYGAVTGNIWSGLQSIAAALASIGEFFKDPWGSLAASFGSIFSRASEESLNQSLKITADLKTGSTDEEVNLKSNASTLGDNIESGINETLDQYGNLEHTPTPDEAAPYLQGMKEGILNPAKLNFAVHAAMESLTLGQFEWMSTYDSMVVSKLGVSEIPRKAVMLPIEKSVFQQAEYFYNRKYVPYIPTYSDLINMVVKEKLTTTEFGNIMELQGYSKYWSGKIWDAHFIAPSLEQILTSFRRGHIPLSEVQRLQILVDLDPIYNNIWKDQYYNDPSLSQARFMFETGAITETQVKDIVVRSGLDPLYVDNMALFLTRFPERTFKRRHLLQVANAYRRGVFDEARLRREVDEAKFTPDVADWIVKMENVRKEINELVRRPEKYRLVTQTYAEDLYNNNDVDETWMRQYFADKGYDLEDVELSMKVLNRKKVIYMAKQVAG